MEKLLTATLMAALVGGFAAPQTARAGDDKILAAIGGFIGGVIVGSQIDDDHCPPPAAVYHAPRHGASVAVIVGSGRAHRGYWDWVSVRTWVPGRWIVSFDDCGRRYRHFERGHYEVRRERVWMTADGRGYGRR